MPSLLISPSRCLSSISLLTLIFGAGCPSDGESCGPEGQTGSVTASAAGVTLMYGTFSSLSGNDCPDPGAPSGVISLSIESAQIGGSGLFTMCIPRPDQLEAGRTFGTTGNMGQLRFIDFTGMADGCTFLLDSTTPPAGMGKGTGVCKNGTDPAGFALDLSGTVNLRRTCGATVDTVSLTIAGKVPVTSREPR